jgi:hypothetical protein
MESEKGAFSSIFPYLKAERNTETIKPEQGARKQSHKNRRICPIQRKLDIRRKTLWAS